MTLPATIVKNRFEGCLLGLAVGDALGGKFEAQTADAIRARFPTDTQMAIGVAEALIELARPVPRRRCPR